MKKNKIEDGYAAINVELMDGKIIVRHTSPTGVVLMECNALDGYWDNVWKALTSDKYARKVKRIYK